MNSAEGPLDKAVHHLMEAMALSKREAEELRAASRILDPMAWQQRRQIEQSA